MKIKTIIIASVLCVSTNVFAHTLGKLYRSRPAISAESDEIVRELRKEYIASLETEPFSESRLRLKFPKQYAVADRILKRLISTSPISPILHQYPIELLVWGDSKKDLNGYTRYDAKGALNFTGNNIGKAESEDQAAFFLAHELSHFLLAQDEILASSTLPAFQKKSINRIRMEIQADENALELLSRAGYDLGGAIDALYLIRVERGECYKTWVGYICTSESGDPSHESPMQRIARVKSEIEKHGYLEKPPTNDSVFKAAKAEWMRVTNK